MLILSPFGSLCCVEEPMGTGKLILPSYWFILFYMRANMNLLVVLHFPSVFFSLYSEISASRLLCLLPTSPRFLAWLIHQPVEGG
jgi:hypothetical protein